MRQMILLEHITRKSLDFRKSKGLKSVWRLHPAARARAIMTRGPLFQDDYSPQFTGHETFPLRYGWLKKVYDRVAETADENLENRNACWGDDAIAHFGVGKNMVAAMRHWAKAVGVIKEPSAQEVQVTDLGKRLFGPKGVDPYMEDPDTLWFAHWQLAARPERTTWFWAFNHYPAVTFERERLEQMLERFARDRGWPSVASKTIKNDVACFIRTYVARQPTGKTGHDDALESPLTELGLIKAVGKRDGFRFVRGSKSTLSSRIFVYALSNFWARSAPNITTLSLEAIAHTPGSPGRVFLLDENDVVDRLSLLDKQTGGKYRWTETAGLKQVVWNPDTVNDRKAVTDKEAA